MEGIGGREGHGGEVYEHDEHEARLDLHPGPERVDDDDVAVHRDDGQGQRRDVHRHALRNNGYSYSASSAQAHVYVQ